MADVKVEDISPKKDKYLTTSEEDQSDLANFLYIAKKVRKLKELGNFDPVMLNLSQRQINFAERLLKAQEDGKTTETLRQEVKNFLFSY